MRANRTGVTMANIINVTRFSPAAPTLDLSRYPAPEAITEYDYETILAARMARLKALLNANGFDYDVEVTELDSGPITQQSDTMEEIWAIEQINAGVKAGLVAFALGADLDHLGANVGVVRHVISPAGEAIVMESDIDYRYRILLATEGFVTGTKGGYIFQAMSAHPHVRAVDVWSPSDGKVSIAVQSRYNDGIPTDEILTAVRNQVRRDDVKPFTDVVSVRPIINIPYTIDVETFVLPGPDPAKVKADIVAAELAMAEERRKPSRDVPRSAVSAAAFVPVADKVNVYKPAQDIARGNGEVAFLTATPVVKVTEYAG